MGLFPHSACPGKVRQIQDYHMDVKGWVDVAYSTLVCPHGAIFEGRGWGNRTAANGTNAGNAGSYAHCYLGGQGDPFTHDGKIGMATAFRLARVHGGAGPRQWNHRDWKATECPGDTIAAFVRAGLPAPAVETQPVTPLPEEEDMIVPVHVPPGEHRVFHVEPTTNGGRDSAIGAKRAILVLNAVGNNRVPAWIYFQSLGEGSPKRKDLWGGQGPFVTVVENRPGGWLDIANNGSDDIGGSLIYVR